MNRTKFLSLALMASVTVFSGSAFAAGPYVSAHGGFATIIESGGGLGFGGALGYDTGDIFSVEVTPTFMRVDGANKLNLPVALLAQVYAFDKIRTYVRLGGGFTAVNYTKFLLDFGVGGDFYLQDNLGLGLIFRYDPVFGANDEAFVLLRAVYRFGGGSGDDDIWD